MTTARPMACSNERESATDASTASQSMAFGDERLFPNTPDAFLATMCSTNLRTRSNDPMTKESVAEADPSRSASSGGKDASSAIVDGHGLAMDVQHRESSTSCGVVTVAIPAGHQTGDVDDVINGDEDNARPRLGSEPYHHHHPFPLTDPSLGTWALFTKLDAHPQRE